MSDVSRIEWTEATWNPVTGCTKVSQGCKHCYAEREWHRLSANPKAIYHGREFIDVQCHPERLQVPIRWTRPRRIFVNSMSDLFHERVPFEFIDKVFAAMSITTRHTYQVLTKRADRMLEYFEDRCNEDRSDVDDRFPYAINDAVHKVWPQWVPNRGTHGGYDNCGPAWPLRKVWLGVSVENQETFDQRADQLMRSPAAIRFLSCEPLLGPIDLTRWLRESVSSIDYAQRVGYDAPHGTRDRVDWVITGGESGRGVARATDPAWVRGLRDQCAAAGVPFFFKQWGEWGPRDGTLVRLGKKAAGRELDGRKYDAYPPTKGA